MTALLSHRPRTRGQAAPLLGMAALALCTAATPSHAADLTWGAAQNIAADTDVLTTDTLVGAFRLGGTGLASATVNGVAFSPFALADYTTTATIGNFRLAFGGGSYSSNTACGSTDAPFSDLPAATRNLLQAGSVDANSSIITLTMSGLTVGQDYSFQWWTNNSGNFGAAAGQQVRATTGTTFVVLNDNTEVTGTGGQNIGGIGQFDVGTFTANATTQSVTFDSPYDSPLLNAFQLRTVPAATPEPSQTAALGLGVLGLAGLALRARRRRAA